MGFLKDLGAGKVGENHVMDLLGKAGLNPQLNDKPKVNKWDIEFTFNNKLYTGEIKFDLYATKSGNIAIEYYNPKSKVDSGVNATDAILWFHLLEGPKVHVCLVADLKKFLDEVLCDKHVKRGGQGGNSAMKLWQISNIFGPLMIEVDNSNISDVLIKLLEETCG